MNYSGSDEGIGTSIFSPLPWKRTPPVPSSKDRMYVYIRHNTEHFNENMLMKIMSKISAIQTFIIYNKLIIIYVYGSNIMFESAMNLYISKCQLNK